MQNSTTGVTIANGEVYTSSDNYITTSSNGTTYSNEVKYDKHGDVYYSQTVQEVYPQKEIVKERMVIGGIMFLLLVSLVVSFSIQSANIPLTPKTKDTKKMLETITLTLLIPIGLILVAELFTALSFIVW